MYGCINVYNTPASCPLPFVRALPATAPRSEPRQSPAPMARRTRPYSPSPPTFLLLTTTTTTYLSTLYSTLYSTLITYKFTPPPYNSPIQIGFTASTTTNHHQPPTVSIFPIFSGLALKLSHAPLAPFNLIQKPQKSSAFCLLF
jgi:hypothetical protein